MYCYAVNGRCSFPAHLWLTGCRGEMETQLQRLPGFGKWIIEKEKQSYIQAFSDQKDNLMYLSADSETVLDELDPIVGGLVDRNRWKGNSYSKTSNWNLYENVLVSGMLGHSTLHGSTFFNQLINAGILINR